MKKSVIVGMICMFVMAGMSNLYAQQNRGERGQRGQCTNLTEEQKDQMKEVRTKYAKETLDLKNELNELRAKQKTLVSAEEPNKNEVYANIDKMTALKKDLNLQKLDMRLEIRSFLTDEQLLRADARQNRGKGMKQGRGGKKGMAQGISYWILFFQVMLIFYSSLRVDNRVLVPDEFNLFCYLCRLIKT